MRKAALYGIGAVILNVAADPVHAASHPGERVMSLSGRQLAHATLVIFAALVAAVVMLCTRYRRAGAWLLLASMAGSFVFGLAYHFLVSGPDHAFTLGQGAWRTLFRASVVLLLLIERTGCLFGMPALSRLTRFPGAAGARGRSDGLQACGQVLE
jgi:hypothetical protein